MYNLRTVSLLLTIYKDPINAVIQQYNIIRWKASRLVGYSEFVWFYCVLI
jgi:hypothetical protein